VTRTNRLVPDFVSKLGLTLRASSPALAGPPVRKTDERSVSVVGRISLPLKAG